MERIERRVVTYTAACHGLVHVLELTYGAVLIGISLEFGVGLLILGLLANFFGFAFGATALPSGFLADRFGERRLLICCCLGTGATSIAVGLSPNILVLGVSLTLLGLTLGIYHPAGAAYIARAATHRGRAFGYLGVGGNLGIALGPVLAGAIAALLGWRASYLAFAIPALLLATAFSTFTRTDTLYAPQPAIKVDPDQKPVTSLILPLALIFTIAILNGFVYRGAVTFLPLYLSQRVSLAFLNLDIQLLAGAFTTIALIFGIGGQFLGGYLSDQKQRESLAIIATGTTVPLLLITAGSQGGILMTAAAIFAFFHFMGQPIYNSLLADYSPLRWRGRSYGIFFFLTFGLGSFSASILGYAAEQWGINLIFTTASGFAFIALVSAVSLKIIRGLRQVDRI